MHKEILCKYNMNENMNENSYIWQKWMLGQNI